MRTLSSSILAFRLSLVRRKLGLSRSLQGAALLADCVLAACLTAATAYAIGPQYQVIGDPVAVGGGTLNDVVSLRLANGSEEGTGAVVGSTGPDANGFAYFAILTADHVAKAQVTQASFGVGPGEAGAAGAGPYTLTMNIWPGYQTFYLPPDPLNNPNNFPEDLSMMLAYVNVNNLTGDALTQFNRVGTPANNFLLAPFPAAIPAPGNSAPANQKFTQLGYGVAGIYNTAMNRYREIAPTPDDARRFQNNTVTTIRGNNIPNYGRYYEPQVVWIYSAPSAAGGGEASNGDSGGPFLTGGTTAPLNATSVSVKPSFDDNTDPNNPLEPGVAIDVKLNFTDYVSAVFVTGNGDLTTDGTKGGAGVPLVQTRDRTTGSLDWALYYANNPTLIPEPGTWAIVWLGAGICGLYTLTKRHRKLEQGHGSQAVYDPDAVVPPLPVQLV